MKKNNELYKINQIDMEVMTVRECVEVLAQEILNIKNTFKINLKNLYTMIHRDTITHVGNNAKLKNLGETMSNYFNEKSTSRFDFGVYRNHTAKKAGSNMLTISTRAADGQQYAVGTTTISMSIREAQALQSFLNESLTTGDSTTV